LTHTAGDEGITLFGAFTDDPVEGVSVSKGNRNVTLGDVGHGGSDKLGDGDSVIHGVWSGTGPTELRADKKHEDSGFDYVTVTVNTNKFLQEKTSPE
jgi:hypothetical protein